MVLTWGADGHGIIDDLAGLQEQFDLPLRRIIQVELVQLDADLFHCRGFGDSGAYSQSCGGAAKHSALIHTTTLHEYHQSSSFLLCNVESTLIDRICTTDTSFSQILCYHSWSAAVLRPNGGTLL